MPRGIIQNGEREGGVGKKQKKIRYRVISVVGDVGEGSPLDYQGPAECTNDVSRAMKGCYRGYLIWYHIQSLVVGTFNQSNSNRTDAPPPPQKKK